MEWRDVGEWLKGNAGGVAGLVGSLLTGNVPGIVTAGVSLVTTATGKTEPGEVLAQLQGDPAALVKLRELAMQNEASIRDHVLALEQARLADVADARKRDIAFLTGGRTNTRANWMVFMAAAGTLGGLISMLALGYIKAKYPDAISEGVFGALLGQLATITSFFGLCLRDAFQFEFGSSRGSREKDELLAKSATK